MYLKKITIIILILSLFLLSCSQKRASAIETTKLFVKYTTNKNIKKLYTILKPEEVKKLKKDKKYLLRLNSQINRYHVKEYKKVIEKDDKAKVEIILDDGTKGFVNLVKLNNKYYIELGLWVKKILKRWCL